jgi:alanyl-tRNA synthetase
VNSQKIRNQFIEYFKAKGYESVDSSSLVPANDPTLLFTNAGMVPFKDVFTGQENRSYQRACSSQKCVRAGGKHNDLEQVGLTARHHTFFEMLGNFVFKGASKSEAIKDAWHLLTEVYQVPQEKLLVTVFKDDHESRAIWENEIGLDQQRVISCGEADNFWSMGDVGPCGPCTEIFYDHGPHIEGGPPGSEDEDGDRYVEVWNLVFMQYNMKQDGSREDLPSLGLDTGMGLERISAVLQGVHNNFETDLFMPIIELVQGMEKSIDIVTARVISDHLRSSVFLISDGVYPSNEGRGYVLRRIMRRAIGFAYNAGLSKPFFAELSKIVVSNYQSAYSDLAVKSDVIFKVIQDEEERFSKTISQGMGLLNQLIEEGVETISGESLFKLYDTYGFPLDMTEKIAQAKGIALDKDGYLQFMSQQQERSRANTQFSVTEQAVVSKIETDFKGYDQHELSTTIAEIWYESTLIPTILKDQEAMLITPESVFYPEGGGQVGDQGIIESDTGKFEVTDTQKIGKSVLHIGKVLEGQFGTEDQVRMVVDQKRQATARNHSATHLLHAALREILGEHVLQKGSLVNDDRLRFDFTHPKPLKPDQLQSIENMVNLEIRHNHAKDVQYMDLESAKAQGVMALFDEKYEDTVRVMGFGAFSRELCGGLHVNATGEIGLFIILSETGIASGVRRIEAITGEAAILHMHALQNERNQCLEILKADSNMLLTKLKGLVDQGKTAKKSYQQLLKKTYAQQSKEWITDAMMIDQEAILIKELDTDDVQTLRAVMDTVRSSMNRGICILLGKMSSDQFFILIAAKNCKVSAKDLMRHLSEKYPVSGGGKSDFAQGKIQVASINALEDDIVSWVKSA